MPDVIAIIHEANEAGLLDAPITGIRDVPGHPGHCLIKLANDREVIWPPLPEKEPETEETEAKAEEPEEIPVKPARKTKK